jgi:NADP-dependent 3-hydroxy acid dehydrogenase YdfG
MAFPSPVKAFHTDTYPAIDPTLPQLSTKGKNIVISGGGTGIGSEIARSFAKSGASSISIFGRTEKNLLQAKEQLSKEYPNTKLYTYVADVVKRNTLDAAFQSIKTAVGPVDILIANAGYLSDVSPIFKADLDD